MVLWLKHSQFEFVEAAPAPQPTQTTQIKSSQQKVVIPLPEESENVTRWIVDQNFRREQDRLKIPFGMYTLEGVL